jgi:hypothetical protein
MCDFLAKDDDDSDNSEGEAKQKQLILHRQEFQQSEIDWLEDAGQILWDVTADKMCAYEWITEGMPRVR